MPAADAFLPNTSDLKSAEFMIVGPVGLEEPFCSKVKNVAEVLSHLVLLYLFLQSFLPFPPLLSPLTSPQIKTK